MSRFPNTRIINGYGPTEATVGVSVNDMTQKAIDDEKVFQLDTLCQIVK